MESIEIEDMPHMAQFVYEFYRANETTIKNLWLETQGMVEGGVGDEQIEVTNRFDFSACIVNDKVGLTIGLFVLFT